MTVKDLIEALRKCPQELPVYIQTYDGSTYDIGSVVIDDIYPEVDLRAK